MYSNHQGKYDTLGIMGSHPKPCTIVIDAYRSRLPITDSFIDLVQGSRLDRRDMKKQMKTIREIAEEVKAGRRYIVFPEGGYAKAPIVPVAIIDSYKHFGVNSLRKVRTYVHFLAPIFFEEYSGMRTAEIAELVKSRIAADIDAQLQCNARFRRAG